MRSQTRKGDILDRLLKEAEENAKDAEHVPRALYNLDKALNKINHQRPKFKCNDVELQALVDKGTGF